MERQTASLLAASIFPRCRVVSTRQSGSRLVVRSVRNECYAPRKYPADRCKLLIPRSHNESLQFVLPGIGVAGRTCVTGVREGCEMANADDLPLPWLNQDRGGHARIVSFFPEV